MNRQRDLQKGSEVSCGHLYLDTIEDEIVVSLCRRRGVKCSEILQTYVNG